MTKQENSGNILADKICKRGENVEKIKLKDYMRKKGLSVRRLSELCDMDYAVLCGRLSGKTEFTVGEIEIVAKCLSMSEAEIMLYFFDK